MGINRRLRNQPRAPGRTCLFVLLGFLLVSCTSVRPVSKLGLLAPFEGLERRSGYIALTAMRQAITDFAPATVALMPLAVDDTADAAGVQRALRKMLQDGAVDALVGPYNPVLALQIQPDLVATGLPWVMPLAIDPVQGFVAFDADGAWAIPLLAAAADQAQRQGSARLILAGWTPGWPQGSALQVRSSFAVPVVVSDALTAIQPHDAIVWVGAPETGAAYFSALRTPFPIVPFFLGPQADGPIFSELAQITGPVYSLFWLDDGYEQWRLHSATPSPMAYLTYRATQQAIAMNLGQSLASSPSWRVGIATLTRNGRQ